MGVSIYPVDANADKRSNALREITSRLEDLQTILHSTNVNRRLELVNIGEHLRTWQGVVKKEKMIYETLNLFNYNVRRKTLIAEGWAPSRDIVAIQLALRLATVSSLNALTYKPWFLMYTQIFRRAPGPVYRLSCTSWKHTKHRRRFIEQTNSQKISKHLWACMESPLIRRSTLVYLRLSPFHSYSPLCSVTLVMALSFFSRRCTWFWTRRSWRSPILMRCVGFATASLLVIQMLFSDGSYRLLSNSSCKSLIQKLWLGCIKFLK